MSFFSTLTVFIVIIVLFCDNKCQGTKLTVKARSVRSTCSTTEELCGDYHEDECGCAMTDCDFDTGNGNRCIPRNSECRHKDFHHGECRILNAFYSIGGIVCKNTLLSGYCQFDVKTSFAINLNGEAYKDSSGILFQAHNSTQQHKAGVMYQNASIYGTSLCKKMGRGDAVEVKNLRHDMTTTDIKHLMWSYIEGAENNVVLPNSGYNERCANFSIPIKEDGNFQLNIKCAEMEYSKESVRRFDIKFNDVTIFPQLDLRRLSGKTCHGMDLMLNFVVRDQQQKISLSGFEPMKIVEKQTKLQFCFSKCRNNVSHVNFIANAFSISRLKQTAGVTDASD